jgi:hypothetical protein
VTERWKAEDFWQERGDVPPTEGGTLLTSNDVLWATFTAGATEATVLPGHPDPGYATVRVRGLGWFGRRRLWWVLNQDNRVPIGHRYKVEKLDDRTERTDG